MSEDKELGVSPEIQPPLNGDPFADLTERRVSQLLDVVRGFLKRPQRVDTETAPVRPEVGIDQTIESASRQGREMIDNFQPDQTGLRAAELRIAAGSGELVIPMDKIFADPVIRKLVDENNINSLSSPVALLEMMVLFSRDKAAGQLLRRVTALANPQLGQSRQLETIMQQSLSAFSLGIIEAAAGRSDFPESLQQQILGSAFTVLFGDLDLVLPWDTARMSPVQKDFRLRLGRFRRGLQTDSNRTAASGVLESFLASDYIASQKQHCAWARETAAKYPLAGNIENRAREALLPQEITSALREADTALTYLDRQVNRIEDFRTPYDHAQQLTEVHRMKDFAEINRWVDGSGVEIYSIGLNLSNQRRFQEEKKRLESQLAVSGQNPETARRLKHRLDRCQTSLRFMDALQTRMHYVNSSGAKPIKVGKYNGKESIRFRPEYLGEPTAEEERAASDNEAMRIELLDPNSNVSVLQRELAAIRNGLFKLRAFTTENLQELQNKLQRVSSGAQELQGSLTDDKLARAFNSEPILHYAAKRFMSDVVAPELKRRKLFVEEEGI